MNLSDILLFDFFKRKSESFFYKAKEQCAPEASFSGDYTIPDGVTSIGDRAFTRCRSLTSVTIPNSVRSIGTWAFYDCSALTSVTIPDGVTSIGELAFYGCSALTSITIPASVTSIGELAFDGCSSLTNITVHPRNPNYTSVDGVLFNKKCTLLIYCPKEFSGVYNILDTVTSIGYKAFYGCSALTSITIPASVTSIGGSAFDGCSALTSITIPASVTSIGELAFSDCSALTSITIPASVTSIGCSAFSDCSALSSVIIGNGVSSIGDGAFRSCSSLSSVIIGNSVRSIGTFTFSDCSALTSITIPTSVIDIGELAFSNCSALTSVLFTGDAPNILKSSYSLDVFSNVFSSTFATIYYLPGTSGWEATYDACPAKPLLSYAQDNGGIKITGVDKSFTGIFLPIPESIAGHTVKFIGGQAFQDCKSLTSIIIPSGVTSIDDHAFLNCNALTNITVHRDNPNYASVGGALFNKDLTVLIQCLANSTGAYTIPASVTSIGEGAFSDCSALTNINVHPDNPNYASIDGILFNKKCTLLIYCPKEFSGTYIIPSGVTSIRTWAFYNCTGLTAILIPSNITSIGGSAFRNCTNLTSITIPDGITKISDDTFSGCTGLISVTIPDGVTSIGNRAFSGCTSLVSITIPASVTSIGNRAFFFCQSLTSITLPIGITSIGEFAFFFCQSLTSATIPDNVTTIDNSAFAFCSTLTSITIPTSITTIGNSAFSYCKSLVSVTIPDGVTSIGNRAFSCCTSLVSITIPDGITSIGYSTFFDCHSLTSVTIPESVTSIGDTAFFGCRSLSSITIPANVTSIYSSAFSGCTSLVSLHFTGDAPTVSIYSDEIDHTCEAFPYIFGNNPPAKLYTNPDTSGWGAAAKKKIIFRSEDEFKAYVYKHVEETSQWEEEDFEILPSETDTVSETAPEATTKHADDSAEDILTPPQKKLEVPKVKCNMKSLQALPVVESSRIGIFPNSTRDAVIGHNFCYNWQQVQAAAQKQDCNLDAFFTVPLAKRLIAKQFKNPVTFWFTPLGNLFVITVCSAKDIDFFNPLHGMPGYVEYGGDYLRPTARPFLQWDGSRVIRVHALETKLESPFLVADFGNNFGLNVSESNEVTYRQIQDDPAGHFEYAAVPSTSPIAIMRNSKAFEVHHALCISSWS